ncbi:hypothetical protein GMRT_15807 [Giardia muris]|uniref:Uncharacterized protein n=1 Tax=Giardia muris TaxID=5742 RepID=A0A4Z1STE5_GIAMU|nr:hypothetical protein GMRT_15807 [Giardia muris]|eukprot:TNJ29164.1 hypothetical protein GMRT_15807 [Giardia muris]
MLSCRFRCIQVPLGCHPTNAKICLTALNRVSRFVEFECQHTCSLYPSEGNRTYHCSPDALRSPAPRLSEPTHNIHISLRLYRQSSLIKEVSSALSPEDTVRLLAPSRMTMELLVGGMTIICGAEYHLTKDVMQRLRVTSMRPQEALNISDISWACFVETDSGYLSRRTISLNDKEKSTSVIIDATGTIKNFRVFAAGQVRSLTGVAYPWQCDLYQGVPDPSTTSGFALFEAVHQSHRKTIWHLARLMPEALRDDQLGAIVNHLGLHTTSVQVSDKQREEQYQKLIDLGLKAGVLNPIDASPQKEDIRQLESFLLELDAHTPKSAITRRRSDDKAISSKRLQEMLSPFGANRRLIPEAIELLSDSYLMVELIRTYSGLSISMLPPKVSGSRLLDILSGVSPQRVRIWTLELVKDMLTNPYFEVTGLSHPKVDPKWLPNEHVDSKLDVFCATYNIPRKQGCDFLTWALELLNEPKRSTKAVTPIENAQQTAELNLALTNLALHKYISRRPIDQDSAYSVPHFIADVCNFLVKVSVEEAQMPRVRPDSEVETNDDILMMLSLAGSSASSISMLLDGNLCAYDTKAENIEPITQVDWDQDRGKDMGRITRTDDELDERYQKHHPRAASLLGTDIDDEGQASDISLLLQRSTKLDEAATSGSPRASSTKSPHAQSVINIQQNYLRDSSSNDDTQGVEENTLDRAVGNVEASVPMPYSIPLPNRTIELECSQLVSLALSSDNFTPDETRTIITSVSRIQASITEVVEALQKLGGINSTLLKKLSPEVLDCLHRSLHLPSLPSYERLLHQKDLELDRLRSLHQNKSNTPILPSSSPPRQGTSSSHRQLLDELYGKLHRNKELINQLSVKTEETYRSISPWAMGRPLPDTPSHSSPPNLSPAWSVRSRRLSSITPGIGPEGTGFPIPLTPMRVSSIVE